MILSGVATAARPAPAVGDDETLAEAKRLFAANNLGELAGTMESRLRTLLTEKGSVAPAEIARLVSMREFARYFTRVTNVTDAQRDTLRFLLASPRLLPTLMTTISHADPP